jgi:hypothetical protein
MRIVLDPVAGRGGEAGDEPIRQSAPISALSKKRTCNVRLSCRRHLVPGQLPQTKVSIDHARG